MYLNREKVAFLSKGDEALFIFSLLVEFSWL